MSHKTVIYFIVLIIIIFQGIPVLQSRQNTGVSADVPEILFSIAKKSILRQLETGKQKSFETIECTDHDRGIFVRLMRHGAERGCIGFVRGVASLEEGVRIAAVDAAFFDPRYRHISPGELDELVMEITLIGRLEPMKHWRDFTIGKHTIYVAGRYGKAVMQAQVAAERGWGKEEFLKAICRKARIHELSYKEKGIQIYRADTVSRRMRFNQISIDK